MQSRAGRGLRTVRNQISLRIVCIIKKSSSYVSHAVFFENIKVIRVPSFSTRTKVFKNRKFVN